MLRPGFAGGVVVVAAVFAGCPGRPATDPPAAEGEQELPPLVCAACDLTQPLNEALAPEFVKLGLTPRLAERDELCRRAGFDLLGRPLSADERADCDAAASFDDALLALQGTDDYLVQAERHWADRIQTDDVIVDFRATVALYDQVDALQRGELRYDEFVVELLRQSGLINADFTGRERVRRVFQTLFLRRPNEGEETSLAPLWRPWLIDFGGQLDAEFPIPRNRGYVMAGFCEPLARCSTTLWGGAAVDLSAVADADRFTPLYLDELGGLDGGDDVIDALGAPGRLFAAQPETYEAEADALLDRFLDWDEGERDIRTPGQLFPQVRAVLADTLRDTGDVPAAERLVLTSLLYLQTADVDPSDAGGGVSVDGDDADRPHPLSVGPTKPILAEAWVSALQNTTSFDYGTCDPRFSDGFPYSLLYMAYTDGIIDPATGEVVRRLSGAEYNAFMQALFAARHDRGRIQQTGAEVAEDGSDLFFYDYGFTFVARSLGGCPGFSQPRTRPAGVAFASVQDSMAETLCRPELLDRAIPLGSPSLGEVVDGVFQALLQRPATADEQTAIREGSGCSGLAQNGDCAKGNLASRLCVGLAGTSEMLFR
jgi:hypothetical protein